MERTITAEFNYTLPVHKEFVKIRDKTATTPVLSSVVLCAALMYLIYSIITTESSFLAWYTLVLVVIYAVIYLIRWYKNRDGDIRYKQALFQNNGQPPHAYVTVGDDGLIFKIAESDNEVKCPYQNVTYLAQSKNLLLLFTDMKLVIILDKHTISGASNEELIQLLREKCPKMKKKVRTGALGRFVRRTMVVLLVLAVLSAVYTLLDLNAVLSGRLTNRDSYAQMAQELEPLGITISQLSLDELAEYDDDDLTGYPKTYKVWDILYWEGYGWFDETTGAWNPSTSGVYYFDYEVISVDTMYTDFLTRIAAMSPELNITNIVEDYGDVDMENGTGTVHISFKLNGETQELIADFDNNWFDLSVLADLAGYLEEDNSPNQLWVNFEDDCGPLLYYGDYSQKKALERKTGLDFTSPSQLRDLY